MEKIKALAKKLPTKNDILRIYKKSPISVFDLFVYVMLTLMAFIFIYPFIHMVTTSLKSYSDLLDVTVKWIPKNLTFKSYITAGSVMRLPQTFTNSVIVTVLATIGHLISCSFVAYGFARYKFPLRGFLFGIVILSILIPTQILIIPMYITYSRMAIEIGDFTFKFLGTYLPLIIPTFFGYGLKGGLFIFLYRQYFLGIPKALEEAATIDGCGPLKTFFRIAFPSAGSTTIVCIVLSMVWHWNDYYEPSLYLSSYDSMLVPQIVDSIKTLITSMQEQLLSGQGNTEDLMATQTLFHNGVTMAGTVISMSPPIIAYFFLQRKFMEGIEHSGLTGM